MTLRRRLAPLGRRLAPLGRRLRVWWVRHVPLGGQWWLLWSRAPRPVRRPLAHLRYRVRRILDMTRCDGCNYVGWSARITPDLNERRAPAVGTEGRVTHAMVQITSGELEHDIDFGDGRRACTPLPRAGIELIRP